MTVNELTTLPLMSQIAPISALLIVALLTSEVI